METAQRKFRDQSGNNPAQYYAFHRAIHTKAKLFSFSNIASNFVSPALCIYQEQYNMNFRTGFELASSGF